MEVIIGKYSGFCQGVKYTVSKANEIVSNNERVYCLGEIVHNETVIKELENKGMITVYSIDEVPNNSMVIFRAHGEIAENYEKAKNKNLEIIDLTCGKIRIIRNKIIKHRNDSYIVIIGKKNHPESIGTLSFAGENSSIIEDESDIKDLIKKVEESKLKQIYVVSQTTFSSKKFDLLVSELKKYFIDIIVDKTICDATEKRQDETKELSKKVNKMIIVGGSKSSNTKELYNIAKKELEKVYLVQDKNGLNINDFSNNDKVGIMAGASTPDSIVDEILSYLKNN